MAMFWNSKQWDPKGKHVYITGGSSGLGLALSKIVASKGAHVSIVARNEKNLASALTEIEGCRVSPDQIFQSFSHSLLDPSEASTALEDVVAKHSGLAPDAVFLCAGTSNPRYFLEYTPSDLSSGMDQSYWVQTYTAHAVTKLMVSQNRTGHITFVSSTLGLMTIPGYSSYAPGKHALRGLADMLRQEFLLYGIDVHIFFPPTMFTKGYEEENKLKPKLTLKIEEGDDGLTAEQAADILFKGVQKGNFQITGNFITDLFRASSRQAAPRNNWILDGLYDFVAYIAVPIWASGMEKQVRAHRDEHLKHLEDGGFVQFQKS
ncbi:oxidoreductase [Stereum hirsutum FP-91666 SS1]|uniref:oxidoreductase n=1 Tax=Stereum hirsutum (strain FP-91666) TaxID=721885 RepID=UPI0004449A1D|nr:oxidoreductase [Stereum hirsutum FP-91666 SS1]EIM82429.1 oxidoreductase [Stereum hirsutum FP-91666 SS1]